MALLISLFEVELLHDQQVHWSGDIMERRTVIIRVNPSDKYIVQVDSDDKEILKEVVDKLTDWLNDDQSPLFVIDKNIKLVKVDNFHIMEASNGSEKER